MRLPCASAGAARCRRAFKGELHALCCGRDRWPGIVGFDDTVVPRLERALLAGHDVVLLGERRQGKTAIPLRPARSSSATVASPRQVQVQVGLRQRPQITHGH